MGSTIVLPGGLATARGSGAMWWPVVAGLLVLYLPTYLDLDAVYWARENGAPGIVVVAIWLWLVWRARAALQTQRRTRAGSVAGWLAIVTGAALYALGRSQQLFQLEVGSQLLIVPGIVLVLLGPAATRRLWFVWAFLAFTVPLPGSLIDSLLVPLKEFVAAAVTDVLFFAGLPIARDGVVIYVGPYQLFIADACSGLNQLVALAAIGVLYVHVAAHKARMHSVLLLASIVPVATIANVLRVTTLVLATYFGGDALGRQLHDYVSYAEIAVAFGTFFVLDHALTAWRRLRLRRSAA
ncbi:MAG: exosortase [Gammaproteobacteria bacterium]